MNGEEKKNHLWAKVIDGGYTAMLIGVIYLLLDSHVERFVASIETLINNQEQYKQESDKRWQDLVRSADQQSMERAQTRYLIESILEKLNGCEIPENSPFPGTY